MHNTGVTESVIFMKFVQFRLHSIILNYNYFVHNSVDQLMIFFPSRIQRSGSWGGVMGSFFFKNTNVHRGVLPLRKWTSKEDDGEGGPKKAILCERNN